MISDPERIRRVADVVSDVVIRALRSMSPADRQRTIDDWMASRFSWTWTADGGVVVIMRGQVLPRVGPAEVRGAHRRPAPHGL